MEIPTQLQQYTWRALREDDALQIQAMVNASVEVDKAEAGITPERVQQLFAMLGDNVGRDTLTAVTNDGTIAALALVLAPPQDDEHLAMISGLVHPAYRNLGIGSHILEWMETRARQKFSQLNDSKPQVLRTSCQDYMADRIALFEQHDFEAVRYSYKMRRGLAVPLPEKPFPDGLQIINWTPEWDDDLRQTFNEAFSQQWGLPTMTEELWQQFFVGMPQFRSDLTYLAMDGDTIVGFCLNWVDEPKNKQSGIGEGWIEAVGTLPAWRGQGLASALLVHSMKAFVTEGLDHAGLDVDTQNPTGALRLYENLGFEALKRTVIFNKRLNST
ncbi:GNAT family N-acetyltransferase [Candidatus Leptofilum sp.]|uniref:GNAT family N-acetyltransferase n=1 Tax=Candidatus Leptofilum sp. TaxID=3241576 RepID=UPI003B5D02A7